MSREDLSFGARFLREAAAKRGWAVTLHPDGAFAGEIRLPDGRVRFFVRSTYDINAAGAALVARDKELTKFFLARLGHPVLPGRTFFSERVERDFGRDVHAAGEYARELGYPVMVKVNSGAGGTGIERVAAPADFGAALERAFAIEDVILIEPYVAGMRDYRLLILDGELLLAYERRPFAVTGNGRSTIRELVDVAVRTAIARGTGTPDVRRFRCEWNAVPGEGELARLLDVANLSQGGSAVEVDPDSAILRLAVEATRAMGLRFCGVDILSDDAERRWILELNASPTIHQFAALCGLSDARLGEVFERVLLAMVRE